MGIGRRIKEVRDSGAGHLWAPEKKGESGPGKTD